MAEDADERWPRWDAAELAVACDSGTVAMYRRLQSWWREVHLHLPPGRDRRGILRGNWLPAQVVAQRPGLNFLDPLIAEYVDRRAKEVRRANGTMEPDRLRRNLLSSQPMCFNLFGYLRAFPVETAHVLSTAMGLDVHRIDGIEVEWAPPRDEGLGDRTAFDAFVTYTTRTGDRRFLGIETKYTEPFTRTRSEHPTYSAVTRACGHFAAGAEARLAIARTNQLWRNALLAIRVSLAGQFGRGTGVVCARRDDQTARRAVDALNVELHDPAAHVRFTSIEDLIDAARAHRSLSRWSDAFRMRYLDLAPVLSSRDLLRHHGR